MALTREAPAPPDTLVIGIGNPLRGDDGAGAAVVGALPRRPHVRYLDVHQLLPELADDLSRAQRVVFIDASVTAREVTVRPVLPGSGGHLGHQLSPETLLELCRDAYGAVPPSAWLVEVPASAFELGAGLSPATARGVEEAAARVTELSGHRPR